jgi:hypothetical protein
MYEMENCAKCKLVREACSMLSLTVNFKPCPKNGISFRPQLEQRYNSNGNGRKGSNRSGSSGSNTQLILPVLIDPNTDIELSAADPIIKYLFKVYGNGSVPPLLKSSSSSPEAATAATAAEKDNNPFVFTAAVGLWLGRWGKGSTYKASAPPLLPLQVWLYESSPFCKVVKETLCELELEHVCTYTPRGSTRNRQALFEKTRSGSSRLIQVPYLQDVNTGVELFESSAICEYLEKVYGLSTSVRYL